MTTIVDGSAGITFPNSSVQPIAANSGPAFSAYQSGSQTISNNTITKMVFNAKEFDTASCFDATTNYRFTPTVAGYYLLTHEIYCSTNLTTSTASYTSLYKNGSEYKRGFSQGFYATSASSFGGTALAYANGTTDYFEIYFVQNSGLSATTGASTNIVSYFQGALVRLA